MAQSAEYFRRIADRYEALAATMRTDKDRETVLRLAAQYHQIAEEAARREAEQEARAGEDQASLGAVDRRGQHAGG